MSAPGEPPGPSPVSPRIEGLFNALSGSGWRVLLLFLLAGFAVYAPALTGEFLWDDAYLVGGNPFFKSPIFIFEVFRHYLFLDSFSLHYRPVQNWTYMLDYWLWRDNTFGYHASNVLYHALSAFVLFHLLKRLFGPFFKNGRPDAARRQAGIAAFLISLIWLVHPVHNAAVAYVAGRADSLAMLFAVCAWLLWFEAAETRRLLVRGALWSGCALLALLALCSKEIALVWLALFALHTLFFLPNRTVIQRLAPLGALLMVLAVYAWLRHLPGERPPIEGMPAQPLAARGLLMLRALGDYATLMFYPAHLQVERTLFSLRFYKDVETWLGALRFEYLSLLGLLTLLAFAWGALKTLPGRSLRIFGAVWFMAGFLPVSNLFPLNAQVAEHWIYMPSAGLLVFVAGCVVALPGRWQTFAAAMALVACGALGTRTWFRAADWADPMVFYTKTIENGGGSERMHLNRALVHGQRGDLETSEKFLRDTHRRFPNYASARINLGLNLLQQGRTGEAEELLSYTRGESERMAKKYPHTWSAALNRAHLLHRGGKADEAMAMLDDAISRHPRIWELVRFKADLLHASGATGAAAGLVEEFSDRHWWHYQAAVVLGRFRAVEGNIEAAMTALRHAASLDIHGSEPFHLMARIALGEQRPEEACAAQLRAVRRAPSEPAQHLFLAAILDRLDRPEEARRALRKAQELKETVRDQPAFPVPGAEM